MLSEKIATLDDKFEQRIDEILKQYKEHEESLLSTLINIQKASGKNYLSAESMIKVAQELDIPLAKLYGVTSFYSLLSTKVRGKYVIRMCENAPCHVTGAKDILEAIKIELGVEVGETSEDGEFTLETTSCLGVCGVAPAMMIGDDVYGKLTPQKAVEIIRSYSDK